MLEYRDGAVAAFEALYARHKGPLFRFVLRSVPERGKAEELHQDIWMRVIEARVRYQPQARFTTWLYTIAHHRLVDHWRRSGLRVVSLDDEEAGIDEPQGNPGHNPERQAAARQGLARLLQALTALPPAQREAFLLHEEAGLSVEEIAAATGTHAEAAKSRLRYALAKLRKALDG
jgi:RNA polymerase sigma-70 factor (ECF subfamily)